MPGLFGRLGLKLALILVAAVVSVSCGSSQPEAAAPNRVVCAAGQIDGGLLVANQSRSPFGPVFEQFERRYGVEVEEISYRTQEDLLSRINAGADPVDLILMDEELAKIMMRDRLLYVLDSFAIPSTANLYARFAPRVEPIAGAEGESGFYSVPYLWGTIGMGINTNSPFAQVEPTWGMMFDLDQAWVYAGQLSLIDQHRQLLGALLIYLGYSPNTSDPAQLEEAAQLLREIEALRPRYDSTSYARLLVDGNVDIAQGRSDEFLQAIPEDSSDYRYLIPGEGAVIWLNMIGVPVTSNNPCSAHSFLDFVMEPRIAGEIANLARAASPNQAAESYISPLLLTDPLIYPPAEVTSKLVVLDRSEELESLYLDTYLSVISS